MCVLFFLSGARKRNESGTIPDSFSVKFIMDFPPGIPSQWAFFRFSETAPGGGSFTDCLVGQHGDDQLQQIRFAHLGVLFTHAEHPLLNRALLSDRKHPPTEQNELLDELLEYVESHLKEKISIRSAALQLLVSESTIPHLCLNRLGISFYRYVTQQRLTGANQLMTEGIPLGQIGEMAGFCDYSAFYRAFRQEYGISPRDYKNSLRENTGSDAQNKNL